MVRRSFKQWNRQKAEGSSQSSTAQPGFFHRLKHWQQPRSGMPQPMSVTPMPDGIADQRSDAANVATSEPISDDRPGLKRSPLPPALHRSRSWRWTVLCLAALGVISGMGAAALLWLVSLPPPPDCKASTTLLDIEQLYCAQQAVQSGGLPELTAGLALLKRWTPEDPLYAETQKLAEDWSKQVLSIARNKVSGSDLKGGLEAVRHIPNTTPVYQEAQEFVAYWQQQWKEGEAIDTKAQEALKQQNWTAASEQVAALADFANPYWNTQRANALAQQIGAEKQARQVLVRARSAAQGGQPEQFGQAITIAQEIPQETYTWQTGRQNLRQWSQTLLAIGSQRWQAGDRTGAITALQAVPRSTAIPELQDLVLFSNAYRLLHSSLPSQQPSHTWFPSWQQVWQIMEAIAAIDKIQPNSPFYQKAQSIQQDLRAQLDDLTQLYYATLAAQSGQKPMLDLAIEQARQIAADRPRRVQAQTLIAYWDDQIERVEDQPYLDRAIALSKSGKIPDLQAAVAAASLIPQGRALRRNAQGRIAAWRDQIETIEDQPYLDQAWAFANTGSLGEAIESAQRIRPDRVLYDQAQSAIYNWQAQLIRDRQIAEDRPLLDRAKAIADSGDLYNAIQVASQITSGRVLYGEAQGLISTWEYQLNPPPAFPELNKPDQKADKSPETPEAAPDRSPDIFTWPDGSLSPYSPPDSSPAPAIAPFSPPAPADRPPPSPVAPPPSPLAPEMTLPSTPSQSPTVIESPTPVAPPPVLSPENPVIDNSQNPESIQNQSPNPSP